MFDNRKSPSTLLSALIAILGLPIQAAYAQKGDSSRDVGTLEEVLVTATKRETSQQFTPLSISSITARQIENTFANDVRAISDLTPNLTLTQQTGFNAVAAGIRGTGSISILVTQDTAVGFLLDDFALNNVQAQFVELFDIQQIEVSRGPQGTLFGKNTTGGAISIKTKQPVFNEFQGEAEVDYGSFDGGGEIGKFKSAINIPLIDDKLAIRFALIYDYNEGFYKNDKDTATFPNSIPLFAAFGLPASNPPLPPELDTTATGNGERLGGREVIAGKAKLLWQPVDNYVFNFIYEYVRDRSDTPPGVNETPPGQGFLIELLGFPGIQAVGQSDPFSTGVRNSNELGINNRKGHQVDVDGFYLNQTLKLDSFSIKSITGYRRQDEILPNTYTGEAFKTLFDATRNLKREQFQQEVRIVSDFDDSPFSFVVGGAYFTDNVDFLALADVGLQSLLPVFNAANGSFFDNRGFVNLDLDFINDGAFQGSKQDRKSWAVFGDGTFEITDRLHVSAGARFTRDDKDFKRLADGGGICNQFTRIQDTLPIDPALPVDPANNVNCIDTRSNAISRAGLRSDQFDQGQIPLPRENFGVDVITKGNWERITWRVAADYSLTDSMMAYFTVATGFLSGGFTETCSSVTTCIPFGKETNINYEIGLKSDLFNNKLRLNLTGFYTEYSNLQRNQVVPFVNSVGNTTQETITINSGKSSAIGVEAEYTWVPISNLRFDGSISYLDHDYDEFKLELTPGVVSDLSNLTPPFSSKWQVGTGVTYEIPFPSASIGGNLLINANFHYQSSAELSVFNSDLTQLQARTLVGASLTYNDPNERYHLTVYGKNLLNETHRVTANSVAGLWNFTQYGPPIQVGVQFGVNF